MEFVTTPSRSALAWRGLANVLLGLILVVWPQITVYLVVVFFAINLIAVGLFSIFEPMLNRDNRHVVLTVALGILGVMFGVYLIIKPEFAASLIGLLIAFWAILFGVYDLVLSRQMYKAKLDFVWAFVLAGIISLLFGLYMLLAPAAGVLTIVWLFGLYVIFIGILLLFTSIFMHTKK